MNTLMSLPTKGDIKQALQNLNRGIDGLDKTYEQAMQRIEGQGEGMRELAKRTLSWIIHAKTPLSTVELRHALAVKPDTTKLDEDYLPSINILRSICVGLVTVDEESDIIRLVHYTTQEFFKRTQRDWFPKAEIDIAKICITYLSFDIFGSGFCQSDKEFERRLQSNPLYGYAARNWGNHCRETPDIRCSIPAFLRSEAKLSASSQAVMVDIKRGYDDYSQYVPRQMRGVHLTAWFGLTEMVGVLIEDGQDPNCKDSRNRTPLSYATENGHEAVVTQLLARADVEINQIDNYMRTPLLYAAENGHEAVVTQLLARADVEINPRDRCGRTPLSWVAVNGHETVVTQLLARADVKVNLRGDDGRTPLSYAAANGHEAVATQLLARADVEVNLDGFGQTPLSWAAANGHEAVVGLLKSQTL
jgi:hypothetical protein